jgi:hypothetical protein
MKNLIFGSNIFTEREIQEMLAKFTHKWVVHIKAVGLLENPDKEMDTWQFYSVITPTPVLNALINSAKDSREAYVLLDTMDEATEAYEHWFAKEPELLESERHLYVRMVIMSPDMSYVFTNESAAPQ